MGFINVSFKENSTDIPLGNVNLRESSSNIPLNLESGGGGSSGNYELIKNKPRINSVELLGNKTSAELGLVDLSYVAQSESSMTASKNYAANDLVVIGGTLYKVTAAITSGSNFVAGTNCEATTLGQQITLVINRPSAAVLG